MAIKTVLFVAFGSGHIKMLLPVVSALAASGLARSGTGPEHSGPSSPCCRSERSPVQGLLQACDEVALTHGRRLMATLGALAADAEETAAYLGLSFGDLVGKVGLEQAESRNRQFCHHAFLPVLKLTRILKHIKPDVVVSSGLPHPESTRHTCIDFSNPEADKLQPQLDVPDIVFLNNSTDGFEAELISKRLLTLSFSHQIDHEDANG